MESFDGHLIPEMLSSLKEARERYLTLISATENYIDVLILEKRFSLILEILISQQIKISEETRSKLYQTGDLEILKCLHSHDQELFIPKVDTHASYFYQFSEKVIPKLTPENIEWLCTLFKPFDLIHLAIAQCQAEVVTILIPKLPKGTCFFPYSYVSDEAFCWENGPTLARIFGEIQSHGFHFLGGICYLIETRDLVSRIIEIGTPELLGIFKISGMIR